MHTPATRFIPIERWRDSGHLYPASESEFRYLLRNRESNGLNKAVVKLGRRILIDEQQFLNWIASHREATVPR